MYNIGVDLGGTNIAIGIVDENHKIVKKGSVPTGAKRTSDAIADDIAALIERLVAEYGITKADVGDIGIATPGIIDKNTGVVTYSCNLPFRNFPIVEAIKNRLGVSNVYLENDANAAALGEAVAGAAAGTNNSVMITLGTGVGGGIIIDRHVYAGFNFAAGELGHIVIEADGRLCSCGRRGCWETYSSATGLAAITAEKIAECQAKKIPTLMTKETVDIGKPVSARTAFACMKQGDIPAKEVVDMYVKYLACGLTNIINIFQPEVITLGGGVSNEGHYLIDPLTPIIEHEQYTRDLPVKTRVVTATLGNDAGIIGAANLGK